MASRTFTLDELQDCGADPFTAVWTGESWDDRWTKTTPVVFEADGRFYKTFYREGLTEYQDLYDWDCYPESDYDRETQTWSLTCVEVERYEKQITATRWRPVG